LCRSHRSRLPSKTFVWPVRCGSSPVRNVSNERARSKVLKNGRLLGSWKRMGGS
jgi:hypothetical protein